MKTLPDYLAHNLKIISIGLNPSPISVRAGYYFANPRNRFWQALNGSRLVDEEVTPGVAAMELLFRKYHIGFTDLVKRPTPMAHALRATDYCAGAQLLREKILLYRPGIAWFHGKIAWRNYLKHAEGVETDIPWGKQKISIGATRVFVTPNPSSANAGFSMVALIESYNAMVSYQVRELFGLGI